MSDALAYRLRWLRDLRPLRHFGDTLTPTPTANYPLVLRTSLAGSDGVATAAPLISVATGCMGARLLTLSWRVSNECTRSTVSYAAIGCTDALLVSRRETVDENKTGVLAQTPLFAACLYLHMRSIGISIKLLSTSSP